MPTWVRVCVGLLVIGIGFLMVIKSEAVFKWIGRVDFAERKFGYGGTRFFIKLIGVGCVFLGIFIVTNIISDILEAFASIFV